MASKLLSAMMIDDCLHDPVLAAKIILGYTVPPHQELRLFGMWKHTFFMDSSGFGTGKTMNLALVAALRAVLMEERVGGIISRSFGQEKIIFQYFDRWSDTNPLFRSQIRKNTRADLGISHAGDSLEAVFANGSRIRCVPPNFLQNSARIASEDWTDVYCDEWVRYVNLDSLPVIIGRARKPIPSCYDGADPVFDHHVSFCGTADFTFNPAYKEWQKFDEFVRNGNTSYDLQSWNYTHYPKRYEKLLAMNIIKHMTSTMSKDKVEREVYGHWVSDSAGFYSAFDISQAREASIAAPILTME